MNKIQKKILSPRLTRRELRVMLCSEMINAIIDRADVNEKQIGKLCGIAAKTIRSWHSSKAREPKDLHFKKIVILYTLDSKNPSAVGLNH